MKVVGKLKTAYGEYDVFFPAIALKIQRDLEQERAAYKKDNDEHHIANVMDLAMEFVSVCVPKLNWRDEEIKQMGLFEDLIPAIGRAMTGGSEDPSQGGKEA